MKAIRFAIIGVGGFGASHLNAVRALEEEGIGQLVAVAENNVAANRATLEALTARQVRHYTDYREMLAEEKSVDVVTIPTGIPLHAPMTIDALEAGFHVYTEKPPAATIQDLDAMIEAKQRSGRQCVIGFQMLSGAGFRHINHRIKTGALGEIKTIVGIGRWRRLDSYYTRNNWAGKLKLGDRWVLDGPIFNPLSHILNNLLILASPDPGTAATPGWVRAELYRAHPIESEDTSCLIAETQNGVRIGFYVTLCDREGSRLALQVTGTRGKALWESPSKVTYDWNADSHSTEKHEVVGLSGAEPGTTTEVFRNLVRFLRCETSELYCPVEQTRPYQITANAAFESSRVIRTIDPEYVVREPEDNSIATCVQGIDSAIENAAAEVKLFSDLGLPWATTTEPFDVKGYSHFPQQFSVDV